ncbi:MAG: hypothetical protein AN485_21970, partial [Anabaena sp. MDT14b]
MVAGQVPGMKWTWSAAANFCVRRLDSGTGPSDAYAPDRFMRSRPFSDAPPISKRPRPAAVGQASSNYSRGQRSHGPQGDQGAGPSRTAVLLARPKPRPGAADWRRLIQPPHPYGGAEIPTYERDVGRAPERHVNYARLRLPPIAASLPPDGLNEIQCRMAITEIVQSLPEALRAYANDVHDCLNRLRWEAMFLLYEGWKKGTQQVPYSVCKLCYLCGMTLHDCFRRGHKCRFLRAGDARADVKPGSAVMYDLVFRPLINQHRTMHWCQRWNVGLGPRELFALRALTWVASDATVTATSPVAWAKRRCIGIAASILVGRSAAPSQWVHELALFIKDAPWRPVEDMNEHVRLYEDKVSVEPRDPDDGFRPNFFVEDETAPNGFRLGSALDDDPSLAPAFRASATSPMAEDPSGSSTNEPTLMSPRSPKARVTQGRYTSDPLNLAEYE